MRELDGNTECFEADEAFFLTTGSWVNNAGKAVYLSPQHAVLARGGFIAKEKYGIFKPLPTDGFAALYGTSLVAVGRSGRTYSHRGGARITPISTSSYRPHRQPNYSSR